MDEGDYTINSEIMDTKILGILTVGDIRRNSARQAITAAGDSANITIMEERFL